MSETIITAESLNSDQEDHEINRKQDIVDSPDAEDENLELDQSSEDSADGDVQTKSDEEAPETEVTQDDEDSQTDSQADDSEEGQELGDKPEKPDIPKWAEKRILREKRKYERELDNYKKQVEQYLGTVANQSNIPAIDPNTQIQDPFTGNIVDVNSVEGQVVVKLQQVLQVQEQQEKQAKTKQAQEELKQKLEKGYAKYEDFHETVEHAGITLPMLEAAYLSDNTDELLYNLAKYKPEEIDRISKLSPDRQFREMVLLEGKMKQSTKKKIVKKVPEPPSKIKGSGASIKNPDDLSFNDLLSLRRKEEAKRLGR